MKIFRKVFGKTEACFIIGQNIRCPCIVSFSKSIDFFAKISHIPGVKHGTTK